jgi:glycosyltransferase involved in cell wall biosynthesis
VQGRFHLIHSFGRLAYLLPILPWKVPKLMTYQRHVAKRSVHLGTKLSRGSLRFSACSRSLVPVSANRELWHVIHNAVPQDRYVFREDVEANAPLVFLGRVEFIKGAHLAIEVARRSGRNLIIAGNVPADTRNQKYFQTEIVPHIDGRQVQYIGPVDDVQKNGLLGRALALLMPILWEEPFGIVMAEALSCGTPVIGLRRGAVPEVVVDGSSGFVCDDVDAMVSAVHRVREIDRRACRRIAETQFSGHIMTDSYLRLYWEMLGTSLN